MSIVFWMISALTLAGGLAAVLLKNLVHCALAVTVAFAGLALLFLQLDAQFAGFAQILVYIGAVAILVVFAILLTRNSETPKEGGVFSRTWLAGLAVAAAVFAVLGWAVLAGAKGLPGGAAAAPAVTVNEIGRALMGRYVLPLEIVALLLTAALIGAVIVAMHETLNVNGNGRAK
ncbi:MAG TPA: NADH-quinone oxidoreductase subunit J [Terracidiphilus sp.]|nr:NADH-quinone oxidoreductase subunit J [Terracidiphilus sp.]